MHFFQVRCPPAAGAGLATTRPQDLNETRMSPFWRSLGFVYTSRLAGPSTTGVSRIFATGGRLRLSSHLQSIFVLANRRDDLTLRSCPSPYTGAVVNQDGAALSVLTDSASEIAKPQKARVT